MIWVRAVVLDPNKLDSKGKIAIDFVERRWMEADRGVAVERWQRVRERCIFMMWKRQAEWGKQSRT